MWFCCRQEEELPPPDETPLPVELPPEYEEEALLPRSPRESKRVKTDADKQDQARKAEEDHARATAAAAAESERQEAEQRAQAEEAAKRDQLRKDEEARAVAAAATEAAAERERQEAESRSRAQDKTLQEEEEARARLAAEDEAGSPADEKSEAEAAAEELEVADAERRRAEEEEQEVERRNKAVTTAKARWTKVKLAKKFVRSPIYDDRAEPGDEPDEPYTPDLPDAQQEDMDWGNTWNLGPGSPMSAKERVVEIYVGRIQLPEAEMRHCTASGWADLKFTATMKFDDLEQEVSVISPNSMSMRTDEPLPLRVMAASDAPVIGSVHFELWVNGLKGDEVRRQVGGVCLPLWRALKVGESIESTLQLDDADLDGKLVIYPCASGDKPAFKTDGIFVSPQPTVKKSWGVQKITIWILAARNVPKSDEIGSSDPYVIIKHQQQIIGTTQVVSDSLNPDWDHQERYEITLLPDRSPSIQDEVLFELWDKDFITDDYLGTARISCANLSSEIGKAHVLNFPSVSKFDLSETQLHIYCAFPDDDQVPPDVRPAPVDVGRHRKEQACECVSTPAEPSGLARVDTEECVRLRLHGADDVEAGSQCRDCFVRVSNRAQDFTVDSRAKRNTLSPYWSPAEDFYIPVGNAHKEKVFVELVDCNNGEDDEDLGYAIIRLDDYKFQRELQRIHVPLIAPGNHPRAGQNIQTTFVLEISVIPTSEAAEVLTWKIHEYERFSQFHSPQWSADNLLAGEARFVSVRDREIVSADNFQEVMPLFEHSAYQVERSWCPEFLAENEKAWSYADRYDAAKWHLYPQGCSQVRRLLYTQRIAQVRTPRRRKSSLDALEMEENGGGATDVSPATGASPVVADV